MIAPKPDTPPEPSAPQSKSSAVWYLACTAAGFAVPLLTLPVFTRALVPDEYGAWVLAYAYGVFVSALSNFGMPLIYERSFFENRDAPESAALLWTTVAFIAGLLAVALLATWIGREPLAAWAMHSSARPALLFWTACAVGVASLKSYFLLYFRNRGEARSYALFTIGEIVLGAAASLMLVAVWNVGPLGLAWGPLAASLLVLVLLLAHFLPRVPPRISRPQLRTSLRLGFPLLPRVFLAIFGQIFDKWLIGLVASIGGVAAYSIGQRLAFIVFAISTALENVFQPRTYRLLFEGGAAAGKEIGRMLTPFAYATVGVALAVGLGAEEAIAFLAPESYAGAVAVTSVLVLHFAFSFFGKQPQLLYAKRTGLVSALSSLSVLLNAAFMWWLATRYGALGAAIGTTLAGALTTSLFVKVSQRHFRIEYERRRLLLIYAFLVAGLAALFLLEALEAAYTIRLLFKLLVLAAYAWMGLACGWWTALAGYAKRAT